MIPTRDRNMSGQFTVTVLYNVTRYNKSTFVSYSVCSNDNARYEQYTVQ
jgi:hypothetical protein